MRSSQSGDNPHKFRFIPSSCKSSVYHGVNASQKYFLSPRSVGSQCGACCRPIHGMNAVRGRTNTGPRTYEHVSKLTLTDLTI
jgi:hypothetical protein